MHRQMAEAFLDGAHDVLARRDNPSSRRETELEATLEELTTAGGVLYPSEDLEVACLEAGITVRRFCDRFGIPSTWYYWRSPTSAACPSAAGPRRRSCSRGPCGRQEGRERFSARGHRRIWGLLRADGVRVSASSVKRLSGGAACSFRPATTPSEAHDSDR